MNLSRVLGIPLLLAIAAWAFQAAAPCAGDDKPAPPPAVEHVKVTWFGHACFGLEPDQGPKVLLDPFGDEVGYPRPDFKPDVLLITHEHFDHNNRTLAGKETAVLADKDGVGRHTVKGLDVLGVKTYHWTDLRDERRGYNTIYAFTLGGIRFCHAGDLGRVLPSEVQEKLGPVDVLLAPVGGYFTLDPGIMTDLAASQKAKIVIPMHYKTPALSKDIAKVLAPVDDFLKFYEEKQVKRVGHPSVALTAADLPPKREVWVLEYREPAAPEPKEKPVGKGQ